MSAKYPQKGAASVFLRKMPSMTKTIKIAKDDDDDDTKSRLFSLFLFLLCSSSDFHCDAHRHKHFSDVVFFVRS